MTDLIFEPGTLTDALNRAIEIGIVEGDDVMDLESIIELIAERFGFNRDELLGTINQTAESSDEAFSVSLDQIGIPPSSSAGLTLRKVVVSILVATNTKLFLAAMLLMKDKLDEQS
jgi:hypothetical protein